MELERDEFVVLIDFSRVGEKELLVACEAAGFPATIVSAPESMHLSKVENSNANVELPEFYTEALESARLNGKPIVLDFMATWCAPCKRIEGETFAEADVARLLEGCELLKIDTDKYPELAHLFSVSGLPDIRLLNSDGKEVKKLLGF